MAPLQHYYNQTDDFIIEPHVCTGKFLDDFNELCSRANLYCTPAVVPRARRPGTPPPPPEAKPEKGGKNHYYIQDHYLDLHYVPFHSRFMIRYSLISFE